MAAIACVQLLPVDRLASRVITRWLCTRKAGAVQKTIQAEGFGTAGLKGILPKLQLCSRACVIN
jgi:hypothetical protein